MEKSYVSSGTMETYIYKRRIESSGERPRSSGISSEKENEAGRRGDRQGELEGASRVRSFSECRSSSRFGRRPLSVRIYCPRLARRVHLLRRDSSHRRCAATATGARNSGDDTLRDLSSLLSRPRKM